MHVIFQELADRGQETVRRAVVGAVDVDARRRAEGTSLENDQ